MSQVATEVMPHAGSKTVFGFWVYLMTDCILFASLFATFVVLQTSTFGGPGSRELFSLPFALAETLILLTSSFTCGLALMATRAQNKQLVLFWFGLTALLGVSFLTLEINEFVQFVNEGASWERSGFLSAFFTLVGTHGLHITLGLIWMLVMMIKVMKHGLREGVTKRLTMLSLFWHFLDVVWIFIFTIVYLVGVVR